MGTRHDPEMIAIIKELRKNRVFGGLCVECPDYKLKPNTRIYYGCAVDNYRPRSPDQVCQVDRTEELQKEIPGGD